jgi:hypothetical protein
VINSLSETIEARRFCVDSVERRREERVLDRFGVLERCGNMISASFRGCDILVVRYSDLSGQSLIILGTVQTTHICIPRMMIYPKRKRRLSEKVEM